MSRNAVIEPSLIAWLKSQAGLAAVITDRLYPFADVPQNPTRPYLTYHAISGRRVRSLKGVTTKLGHPVIQFDCWDRSYQGAKDLAAALRDTLDGIGGVTMGGREVQAVLVDDARDLSTPPEHGDEIAEFRVQMDAEVWFTEL